MITQFSRQTIIALASTLLLLSACAVKQNGTAAKIRESKAAGIVNGTLVSMGDDIQKSTALVFTWNSKIKGENIYICSASLISKNLLVTAAHCLVDDKNVRLNKDYQVYVSFDTTFSLDPQLILKNAIAVPWEQAVANADYKRDDPSDSNDIALIKLPQDAPAGQEPIAILPDDSVLKKPNMPAVIAGFGLSSPKGDVEMKTGVYKLRQMTTFVEQSYENMPDIIVTANWGDQLATAQGDSGGPGFVVVDGKTYLFGADSEGNDHSAYFTNLRRVMPWLKATATALQADLNF